MSQFNINEYFIRFEIYYLSYFFSFQDIDEESLSMYSYYDDDTIYNEFELNGTFPIQSSRISDAGSPPQKEGFHSPEDSDNNSIRESDEDSSNPLT